MKLIKPDDTFTERQEYVDKHGLWVNVTHREHLNWDERINAEAQARLTRQEVLREVVARFDAAKQDRSKYPTDYDFYLGSLAQMQMLVGQLRQEAEGK